MEKELQSRKQPWSKPQMNEIKVKMTEKHDSHPPHGHHYGKNAIGGNDAFSIGHQCS